MAGMHGTIERLSLNMKTVITFRRALARVVQRPKLTCCLRCSQLIFEKCTLLPLVHSWGTVLRAIQNDSLCARSNTMETCGKLELFFAQHGSHSYSKFVIRQAVAQQLCSI